LQHGGIVVVKAERSHNANETPLLLVLHSLLILIAKGDKVFAWDLVCMTASFLGNFAARLEKRLADIKRDLDALLSTRFNATRELFNL
jgi:hypothetical protein